MDRRGYYYPSSFQGFYENSLRASPSQAYNPSQFQGHLFGNSLQVSQMQNLAASISEAYNNPPSQMQSSQASTSSSPSSSPETVEGGKRSYDKWSDDEEKMLISLWAENIDRINSSQARKALEDIATQMNKKFGSKRATESCKKKMKYLLERYKVCKDWNSKQTGGNLRKSAHFDEIDGVMGCRDIVTLSNVKEAGSAVSQDEEASSSEGGCVQKKEARTSRKKTKKREREEENDNEERKMFRAAFSGLETQRNDMNTFVTNFTRMQEQQVTTMNALVGALSKFLEKQ